MTRVRDVSGNGQWGRRRLLAVAVAAVAAAGLLLAGLGLAVYYTLAGSGPDPVASPAPSESSHRSAPTPGPRRHPVLATTSPGGIAAALPGALATVAPEVLALPVSTRTGPAGVPTGFPRTATGAVAQLAAIDSTALQTASLPGVRAVITGWAAPGGPTPSSWSGVRAMAGFLSAAGLPGTGSPRLTITATPAMALVRHAGHDEVVACIDFAVEATLDQTKTVAVADCQSMVWQDRRWVIGPGPEPAGAAAVWPGSPAAVAAGWQELRYE